MGFTLMKPHPSLETYSKRVNKSKSAYHRRKKPDPVTQSDAGLLKAAVLPTSSCNHKQLDLLATGLPTTPQRNRRVTALSPSSRSSSESETSGDRLRDRTASRSARPQQPNSLGVYSQTLHKRVSESSSQDPTSSIHRGENNPASLGEIRLSVTSKKRGLDSRTLPQDELPPIKRTKQSITNYFKPVPRSSSPPGLLSSHDSSDTFKPTPTPPSSPPSRYHKPYPRKYQKRRLTTRPCLQPIMMSSNIEYGKYEEDEDSIGFTEAVGDMTDGTRSELAEEALDREDARDAILSTSFPLPRSAYLAGSGSTLSSGTRSRSNASAVDLLTTSSDENNSPRADNQTSAIDFVAATENRTVPVQAPQHKLRQMYLDPPRPFAWIQCEECGKYYDPTSVHSTSRHDLEHPRLVGAKVTKKQMSTVVLEEWTSDGKKHCIVVIDCKQATVVRAHGWAVLDTTYEALGSLHVKEEELWREISDPQSIGVNRFLVPRFRIYVHYIDNETIAVVLAERIRDACTYHPGRSIREDGGPLLGAPGVPPESPLLGYDLDTIYPVWASIERVWVREDYRRKGYATNMVDTVRKHFVLGLHLTIDQIAFSCPFGSGVAFATRYCKGIFGRAPFLVNADEVIH